MDDRNKIKIFLLVITYHLLFIPCLYSEPEMWFGTIKDIKIMENSNSVAKINLLLQKQTEIINNFDETKAVIVQNLDNKEKKLLVQLDGVASGELSGFNYSGKGLISKVSLSSIDGSFSQPGLKITKQGESVRSSTIELTVLSSSIVRASKNKEDNQGVELSLIVDKVNPGKKSEEDANKTLEVSLSDFYDQPSILNIIESGSKIDFTNFAPGSFISLLYSLKNMDVNIARTIVENKLSSLGSVLLYAGRSTLIITDYVEYVESVYNLLNNLDKEIPQVMIEVKVVEVFADNKFAFGLDWQWGENSVSGGPFSTSSSVTAYGGGTGFSGSDTRATNVMLQTLTGANYSKFWVSLETLAKDGKAEIEARPKVVVLNNEKAVFTSGESYPYRKEYYDTTNNKNYFVNDLMPTGINLTVVPHIKDKDLIVMEISSDITNIIAYDGKYDMPVLGKRSTTTSVKIQDGDTIVLGGLFKKDKKEQEYGIPLLKDIPLIGFLFKNTKNEERKTEILITLTPKILK